ncbi:MAG: MarR family transcriptional regulator [Solobacterium sp.]|nr:MarR family transcriptional regulator [Solobacterium sp.]MBQ6531519.1 MarR family transcriptional regulator [Solobacterium sp.]
MKEEKEKINLGMTSREISDFYMKQMEYARLVIRTSRRHRPMLDEAGITETEVTILNIIDQAPGITSQEIARETATTKGAVAQIIKSLDGKGLLIREREGRMIHLSVTEKAHELVLRDRQEGFEWRRRTRQFIDDLSAEDFRTFMKVMDRMILLMREAEPEQEQ